MSEHILQLGGTPWALVYAAAISLVGGMLLTIYRLLRGEANVQ